MRTARRFADSLLAAAFVALAACSSAGGSGGGGGTPAGGSGVAIQVINDVVPPTNVTVWIVPEAGGRRRLGTIRPNGQETFNFNPGLRSMEHRLVAESSGGSDQTSNPFVLEGVQGIRWSVSSVVIRTIR